MQVKFRGTSFVPVILALVGTGWEILVLGWTENKCLYNVSVDNYI